MTVGLAPQREIVSGPGLEPAETEDSLTTEVYGLGGHLTAVLHFDVEELHVAGYLLGSALETTGQGKAVRIEFPSSEGRFRLNVLPDLRPIHGWHGERGDPSEVHMVRQVQVQVDLARGLGDEGPGNAEYVLLREAQPIATDALRTVLDWARTRDKQVWLLPPHVQPALAGPAVLINEAGERTHGYPLRQRGGLVMLDPEDEPTGDLARAFGGATIPQAESLLAEAAWAVWPTQDPDSKRAILLAAIALEVKVPQVLRVMARGKGERLLDVLLDRPDESRLSTSFQLNQMLAAFGGTALRHHDGKLAKEVKTLFALRNDVAHRGVTPEVQASRRAVAAAERVFAWLDSEVPSVPT